MPRLAVSSRRPIPRLHRQRPRQPRGVTCAQPRRAQRLHQRQRDRCRRCAPPRTLNPPRRLPGPEAKRTHSVHLRRAPPSGRDPSSVFRRGRIAAAVKWSSCCRPHHRTGMYLHRQSLLCRPRRPRPGRRWRGLTASAAASPARPPARRGPVPVACHSRPAASMYRSRVPEAGCAAEPAHAEREQVPVGREDREGVALGASVSGPCRQGVPSRARRIGVYLSATGRLGRPGRSVTEVSANPKQWTGPGSGSQRHRCGRCDPGRLRSRRRSGRVPTSSGSIRGRAS